MTLRTIPWEITDHLRNEAEVAAYLDAVFEGGDAEEIRDAIGHVARLRGIAEMAQATGVSRSGLYKALGEDGNPSFETVLALLASFGVRLSVMPVGQHAAE